MSTTKKTSLKDLYNKLNDLKTQYDSGLETKLPEKIELEKMTYDAPTDDEIMQKAKNMLESKYQSAKNDVTTSTNDKIEAVNKNIEQANERSKSEIEKANSDYDASLKSIEEQAIKRGIQRSSIALGELSALEKGKLDKVDEIETALKNQVGELNGEIQKLESELKTALSKLDMQHAVELDEKIEALKAEREEKQNEVLKYNNQIVQAQANYNNEYNEKYPNTKQDFVKEVKDRMLNEVVSYYLSYEDGRQALEDFTNEGALAEYLGDDYELVYNILKIRR